MMTSKSIAKLQDLAGPECHDAQLVAVPAKPGVRPQPSRTPFL